MQTINFLRSLPATTPGHVYKGEVAFVGKASARLTKLSKITAIAALILLGVSFGPSVWYTLSGSADRVSEILGRPIAEKSIPTAPIKEAYQPRFDASLPKEATVRIPSIGVVTTINEATYENFEEALKKGVWRVSDFGTPFNREDPTILAAHRYGYLAWSNLFRSKSSFYNLPKLKQGDIVEIIWRQRKYTFAVYAESEGEHITDYSADLILYTCKDLNSPIRQIKYARLLEI